MHKMLFPLTLVAAFGAATTAAYADQVTGTIDSIDPANGHVTLNDGWAYDFSQLAGHGKLLGDFKSGDWVTIDYARSGTAQVANAISPARAADMVIGRIAEIDPATSTVTLQSGVSYDFSQLAGHATLLRDFMPGDRVAIAYSGEGSALLGDSLSPAGEVSDSVLTSLSAVDPSAGTVTLRGGTVVNFTALPDHAKLLAHFMPGDRVTITYAMAGTQVDGNSIAPAM